MICHGMPGSWAMAFWNAWLGNDGGLFATGYQPTYEWLSRSVRSPLESRPGSRGIQKIDDQCPVSARKRALEVTRLYVCS